MDDATLRTRIEQLVKVGVLTCDEPEHTWAGQGTGQRCAICRELIGTPKPEYEVELPDGRTLVVDRRCYDVWRDVCDQLEATPGPSAPA
jgi:hypothetical protein